MYGISSAPARLDGAHAQHVLRLFIDHHVDDVIHGHKADDASFFLQHRDCKQVVFANLVGDRLLAVVRARGNRLGPHDFRDDLGRFHHDEVAERERAKCSPLRTRKLWDETFTSSASPEGWFCGLPHPTSLPAFFHREAHVCRTEVRS